MMMETKINYGKSNEKMKKKQKKNTRTKKVRKDMSKVK